MNKQQRALIEAYEKGYRVVDGVAYRSDGFEMSSVSDRYGYLLFKPNKNTHVYIHRLLAYQKYGDKIFNPDIQVRHKDGNKQNNLDENILIGDQSKNMMDIPVEIRMKISINAATKKRKFTDDEMIQIKKDYELFESYDKVMDKWNISSKGTLHYMLNKKYVTKV